MIWTTCGELYPSRYQSQSHGAVNSWQLAMELLLRFFSSFIIQDIDFRYGYVFAGCNVLGGLLVYCFVLEGQGRTLEELDTMFLEGVKPWNSAKGVAPPPEEMERIRKEAGTHDDVVAIADDISHKSSVDDADAKSTDENEKAAAQHFE